MDKRQLGKAALLICSGGLFYLLMRVVMIHILGLDTVCVFRAVTGAPCPGCGLTRALLLILRGRPLEALRMNVLALPLCAAAVVAAVCAVVECGTALRPLAAMRRFAQRHRRRVIAVAAVMAACSWALNLWHYL